MNRPAHIIKTSSAVVFAASSIVFFLIGVAALNAAEPVYRQIALSHDPGIYTLAIHQTAESGPADSLLVHGLLAIVNEAEECNVRVRQKRWNMPLEGQERTLWDMIGTPEPPFLTLHYPDADEYSMPVWSGPLDRNALKYLLDSPARQQIIRHLSEGSPGVWVLIGDTSAEKSFREELSRINRMLGVSLIKENNAAGTGFGLVSFRRNDPSELILTAILTGSEPDLYRYSGQPMAFLVFGRGKVLYALVGDGINASNIADACGLLIKQSSAPLPKEALEGIDLLLLQDWEPEYKSFSMRVSAPDSIPLLVGVEALTSSARMQPVSSKYHDSGKSMTEARIKSYTGDDTPAGPSKLAGLALAAMITGLSAIFILSGRILRMGEKLHEHEKEHNGERTFGS